MKVTKAKSIEELIRSLDGTCDMGDNVTRPKCTETDVTILMIQTIDNQTFVMQLCGPHKREIERMMAANKQLGGIRWQEEVRGIDAALDSLKRHKEKGDA